MSVFVRVGPWPIYLALVINDKVATKERKKDFEISRISRFRHRTRYFTDSDIIDSKEIVHLQALSNKFIPYSLL